MMIPGRALHVAAGVVMVAMVLAACGDQDRHPLTPVDPGDPVDPPEQPDPEVVAFPDSLLERAIREALEFDEGELTTNDLLQLTELSSTERGITDLRGLEHCRNLENLFLMENGISDESHLEVIGRLSGVRQVLLQNTGITTLDGLIGVEKLSYLAVSSRLAVDLSALSRIPTLKWLSLSIPNLSDLGPVAALSDLTYLGLHGNQGPADLASIAGLTKLDYLAVFDAEGIADLAPLSDLLELRWLILINSTATDLSPLSSLHRLEDLDLRAGHVHDLAGIMELESLETVVLSGARLHEEAVTIQIPALRARGVNVRHAFTTPVELFGVWSLSTILVDGAPVDVAEHLDWPPDTAYRFLSFDASSEYAVEDLAADAGVLRRELGHVEFRGDEVVMSIREVDGEEFRRFAAFRGTWQVSGDRLILTTTASGETVEMVWTR